MKSEFLKTKWAFVINSKSQYASVDDAVWNWKSIVYYEILLQNKVLNKYCSQLQHIKGCNRWKALANRKGVVLHQNNDWLHVRPGCNWNRLAGISDDTRHTQLSMHSFIVAYFDHNKKHLLMGITSLKLLSLEQFLEVGIVKLSQRWRKVVEKNGAYMTE